MLRVLVAVLIPLCRPAIRDSSFCARQRQTAEHCRKILRGKDLRLLGRRRWLRRCRTNVSALLARRSLSATDAQYPR